MSTMTVTQLRPAPRTRGSRGRPPATVASRQQGQLRLTRRGRVVVVVAALLLLLAAAVFAGAGSVATERPGTPEPTRSVVVAPGDTLWGIAAEVATDGDVRGMVERIQRLNTLDSGLVQAGQRLQVPAAAG
jgi:LysM repeat protein